MIEVLKVIGSLSLSASVLALVFWTIKPLIRHRISKVAQYAIWLLIIVRLMLPFSFEFSVMNQLFQNMGPQTTVSQPAENQTPTSTSSLATVQQRVAAGVYNGDVDHSRYLSDLLVQSLLTVWLLGFFISMGVHLTNYLKFSHVLKSTHQPADESEQQLLNEFLPRGKKVQLLKNSYIHSPMLIGCLKPRILLPDQAYTPEQLRHILIHEVTHLKHFDIAFKWLTLLANCLHWFNPLVYLIKAEVNRACELACDEAVIKSLSKVEKQSYGETLILVASENHLPQGALRATLVEEKNSLKERLQAIMKHPARWLKGVSVVAMLVVVAASLVLGGFVSQAAPKPKVENSGWSNQRVEDLIKAKTPYLGNSSRVLAITSMLPWLDEGTQQQYISMKTSARSYGLTVYYEAKKGTAPEGFINYFDGHKLVFQRAEQNALVLFCTIDNLEQVTLALRDSPSESSLDEIKYTQQVIFNRQDFVKKYGPLGELTQRPEKLKALLGIQ